MSRPASESKPGILIVGGYGAFGARAAERLARHDDLRIVIAGRSPQKAKAAADELSTMAKAEIGHATVDAEKPDIDALRALDFAVFINASGPYQAQDYSLARAAIEVGAHYIDLADARAFVTGITVLDAAARTAGVLVTSGASSVPALAAAIIDAQLPAFGRLDEIHHGITPGNGYDPGEATTASILGSVGKPMRVWDKRAWSSAHGWLGLWRYDFPGLGPRFMTACDVPDLDVFPARYPGVTSVRFSAGLEVAAFQLSLWALAGLVRIGLVQRPERLAGPLMWLKRRLKFLGSDAGGMFVRLRGLDKSGGQLERTVLLIARRNQGPYVPAIASVVLARRLASGDIPASGAMPCVGLLTLAEIEQEVADLAIEIVAQADMAGMQR